MTEIAEKPKREHPCRKDYTDTEVDAGLTAYAICSGRHKKAAELLKATTGYDVPAETIRSWATRTHPERYTRIRDEVAPKLQTQMADTHQALADMAGVIERKAAEKLDTRLEQGDIEDKDLANIYKNAAIVSGIHTEKAELLNGRPTHRRARTADEVLRSLKAKSAFIEVESTEIEPQPDAVGAEAVGGPAFPSDSQP